MSCYRNNVASQSECSQNSVFCRVRIGPTCVPNMALVMFHVGIYIFYVYFIVDVVVCYIMTGLQNIKHR